MTKAKAKKRFVLGEGYPFLAISNRVVMYKSRTLEGPYVNIEPLWPGSQLQKKRYRLVLEEI